MGNIFTNPKELIEQMNSKYDNNEYTFRIVNTGKKNPDIEVIVGQSNLTISFLDEGGIVLSAFAEYDNDLNDFANALSGVMGEYAFCNYYLVEPMTGIEIIPTSDDPSYNDNAVPPLSLFVCEWSAAPEKRLFQLYNGKAYDYEEVRNLSTRYTDMEEAELFNEIVNCENNMMQAMDTNNDSDYRRLQEFYTYLCDVTTKFGVDLTAPETDQKSFMCWYVRQSYNAQVEERQANNQEMVLVSDKQ